ncbi:winged helix-turn-helix domain-containing protein [Natronolimnohabitans innermongolicus]|uniref:ArsR family transcriptional regulator n=1 Tax=Natronolimnohabitans innermongolicus JCM 12255 TaxID=1227499 RepID=L9XDQ8_9EURY|nr:winged helix-turn-helix domain-containing protein [Natronolimnohabitans innermongolicus]ELY58768.1 hypothetical protein C493_06357 [Natronolimnohabitans innermongolicus JCM 12255]
MAPDGGDASETERDVDAREAFSLLGHEIRLEILLALLEDWVAIYTEPKSYAELMDAVGVRDSGKFNYHLEQLRGVYVRQVEDGYVPTASATALYRAVLAHRPTETFELESTPIDADCPVCGKTATLRYERGFVSIDCATCEEWVGFTYSLPQRAFDGRDVDAVLEVLDARVRHDLGVARRGQCPDCGGATTVDPRLEAVGDAHWVELACETCSLVVGIDLPSAMLTDDRVAAAFREVSLDPERYLWELPAGTTRLESREPTRLAVDLEGDGGTVTIVVDEALALESVAVRSP